MHNTRFMLIVHGIRSEWSRLANGEVVSSWIQQLDANAQILSLIERRIRNYHTLASKLKE